MNFREKRGGVTPIRKIWLQILVPPEKKRNIVFRNKGGGLRGRLEVFRKFIQIWERRRPLVNCANFVLKIVVG